MAQKKTTVMTAR
uniref:Uncharacterized protein n=1 Tax=Arundo donax TaxID=35708 RepID=A0A0A9F9B7_ARUDO